VRRISFFAGLAFAGLAACHSSPSGPFSGGLDGKWAWDFNGNPGGSWMILTLATAGIDVSGTGVICGVGPSCNPGPVTITGQHGLGFGPFRLTVKGAGGYVATYAAQLVSDDQVQGTWTVSAQAYSVTLNRCPPARFC
jgi:hypothetical protein